MVRYVATAVLGLSLAACAGSMRIESDFDATTDFSQYRTYTWAGEQRITGDPRLDNPLLDARIRSAIDQQLTAIGLRQASGSADLGVRYHAVLDDRVRVDTYREYYTGVFRQTSMTTEYTEGTLVLDLYDAKSNKLVWQGSAEAEVHLDNSPELQSTRINEAVRKMLEGYPRR